MPICFCCPAANSRGRTVKNGETFFIISKKEIFFFAWFIFIAIKINQTKSHFSMIIDVSSFL
jgi:hypothetical protein